MRRFFVGWAILALAALLGGCELRADVNVDDDGSGTVGVTALVEPQYLGLLSAPGGDPFAEMKKDFADDPVDWKVQDIKEGSSRGIYASFHFTSIKDLKSKTEAMQTASGSGSDTGLQQFTLKRDGSNSWTFEGRPENVQEQIGSGNSSIPADQLASLLKLQFRITLPGRARSSNAARSSTSGGRTTFVWTPSIKDASVRFAARTVPGGTVPVLPIGIAAGVTTVVAAVAILRDRWRPAPAGDATPPHSADAALAAAWPPSDQISP
jgi:hypothetical protein